MIETLTMETRAGVISDKCKMLYKMSETSGDFVKDTVTGAVYNPSAVGPLGSISFDVANAVRIENNGSDSTPMDHNIVVDTRKVFILAAHLTTRDPTGSRVNLGVAGLDNVASASGKNSFHITFGSPSEQLQVSPGSLVLPNDTDMTLYIAWNGAGSSASVNGEMTGKVLNADGTVYNNGVSDYDLALSGIITPDSLALGNFSRLFGADYYEIGAWEYDTMPSFLDAKLAQWGEQARAGFKAGVTL